MYGLTHIVEFASKVEAFSNRLEPMWNSASDDQPLKDKLCELKNAVVNMDEALKQVLES